MLKLFQKKSKVKEGKQTQADASAQNKQEKKQAPLAGLGKTWKKLNSMDRKQAYTWGAVILVGVIGLLILASAASGDQDDFSDFETRGYDLANMPFSSDEAEQYLLASKYPDMEEGSKGMGLYSEESKEARQEEDAEQAELDTSETSAASEYVPGRYYGGGSSRGVGARTKVGSLNSASIKGASGSGLSSKFGPSGDFSNFRSQNKGSDKAPRMGRGTDNARKALRQTAMASRAAAGLKNDKMLNAKKALMGGTVDGSKAFMDDSGAVNLGEAAGLDLDTNAPSSSTDLSGLDQGLNDAKEQGQQDASDEDENSWEEFFKNLGQEVIQSLVQGAISMGLGMAEDAAKQAMEDAKLKESHRYTEEGSLAMEQYTEHERISKMDAGDDKTKAINDYNEKYYPDDKKGKHGFENETWSGNDQDSVIKSARKNGSNVRSTAKGNTKTWWANEGQYTMGNRSGGSATTVTIGGDSYSGTRRGNNLYDNQGHIVATLKGGKWETAE